MDDDLDREHLLTTAADFVAHVVAVGASERALAEDLIWRFRPHPDFDGAALPLSGDRVRVTLNAGLADGLHGETSRLAANAAAMEALESAFGALGGVQEGLGAAFASGLVFVALHEAAHMVGGHLTRRASMGDAPSDDGVLEELEADGAAVGLTLEFAAEIIAMSRQDEAPPPPAAATFAVAALGVLLALSATPARAAEGYPSRSLRILNALASMSWRAAETPPVWKGDDYVRAALTEEEADAAGERIATRLLPVLIALSTSHGQAFGFPDLLGAEPNALKADVLTLLGGGRPEASETGRALASLSERRPAYLAALEEFRRTRFWK